MTSQKAPEIRSAGVFAAWLYPLFALVVMSFFGNLYSSYQGG